MNNQNRSFAFTKAFVVLLLILFTAGAATAGEVQKVGTTSMQTLRIASSVRAIGMGETYVSVADGIDAVFWNPAGLIHVEQNAAQFSQINMPAGIQFNTAAYVRNLGRTGVFGVHMLALSTDDMPVRTVAKPEGTGEYFMAYDFVPGVSWAQRLTDRFIFGSNLRLALSGIEDETYTGFLVDFGTLYETHLRSIKLGMSLQNFGPDVDYSGRYLDYQDQGRRARTVPETNDYTGAPPPTIYRIGLSANLFELTGVTAPDGLDGIIATEMSHPNDNRERINFGLELSYVEMIMLRAGYKLRYKNVYGYDEERWTAGFGLNIPVSNMNFILDYAYNDFGRIAEASEDFIEKPHRFSLSFTF
ncbi:PorV/PorQ family protein [Calditrichota bacterium]